MGNKPRDDLHYFKWEVIDAKTLQQLLEIGSITLAQVGELFLAVMAYVNQENVEISPELTVLFTSFKVRVDNAREARVKVGKTRGETGALGGNTKAENEKIQKATGYKPPAKKQFKTMILQMEEGNEICEEDVSSKDIDDFFTQLRNDRWTIKGEPIRSDADLVLVLRSKFGLSPREPKRSLFFPAFESAFAKFPNLRDNDNNSLIEDAVSEFFDTYDDGMFLVNGKKHPQSRWEEALHSFIEQWAENIPP